MLTATLTDEDAASSETPKTTVATTEPEADYVFEGFQVEFSERIMLIPLGMGADPTGKG